MTLKQKQKQKKPPKAANRKTQPKPPASDDTVANAGERINRYLAGCGLCSRREADRWVEAGRVNVNGKPCREPGVKIKPGDRVSVDGNIVERQQSHTYILYNKPTGQLCSRKDEKRGRPLIYDFLDVAPNVQSLGRLDMDTEGLLILTDDGDLTRALTRPGAKVAREYRARVAGVVEMETLEKLRLGGIDIGQGERSDGWEITVDSETRGHTWLTIVIHRGRWREVRRTLEACDHPVRRLIRTRFASLRLEEGMPKGSWRTLNRAETRRLKERT